MAYHNSHGGATFVPGGYDDYYMPSSAPELISPEPQRINPEMPQQIQHGIQNMNLSSPPLPQTPSHPPPDNDLPNFSPFPKLVNRSPGVPQSDDELEATLENARQHVLNSNDPEMQLAWAADALMHVGICADQEERIAAANPRAARPSTPRIEHQLKSDAMNVVTFLADQHHPRAEFLKGMWLEWGRFGQREDKKEAFRCYSRAADKGFTRAEYRIGMLYESYNDPVKAVRHYNRGVDAGDAASCYRLGMMTLRGQHGQKQDYRRAVELIQQSADKADENAAQGAYVYGMLLTRQLPQIDVPESILPPDEHNSKLYIEKAAFHRFAKAQLKMGSAYELGDLGCAFDPALSMHYNALAAKQGESEAEMALSKWFLVGSEGLFPKNEELAYVYAERAANGGLAIGEFALGYFHEIGMHVPVSIEKALEWYTKASQHGNEDAKTRIEALANKQVLNKRDAENFAISRIKSQYGSQRGARPERFQQNGSRLAQVTTVNTNVTHGYGTATWHNDSPTWQSDSPTSVYSPSIITGHSAASEIQGPGVATPRNNIPYPLDDRPPTVAPLNPNRPASVTPYPLEDRPLSTPVPPNGYNNQSRPGPPRLGPTGGFFNAPHPGQGPNGGPQARPSSAFQINPNLQSGPNMGGQHANLPPNRPNTVQPHQQPYGHGPGPGPGPQGPGGYNGNFRPTIGQGGRIASGPPAMQGFAPHNNNGGPPPGHGRPGPQPDIGYSAPYDDRRPQRGSLPGPGGAPSQGGGHYGGGSSGGGRGGRPGNNFDSPRPHPKHSSTAPGNGPAPVQKQKPLPSGPPGGPTPNQKNNSKPATSSTPAPTSSQPPNKGPKTFEEMGVPSSKKDSECTIM